MELLREKLLKAAQNSDDRLLLSRIADGAELADRYGIPRFTPFLDARMLALAEATLYKTKTAFYSFGGYDEAERKMLCFHYEEVENEVYPITPIIMEGREIEALGHRDVLGSLMGLSIKREKIGDIFRTDGFMIMADSSIAEFITQNLDRVGKYAVKCRLYEGEKVCAPPRLYKEVHTTVASPRLDAVTAIMAGVGRKQATELIQSGRAAVNNLPDTRVSRLVADGDKISVRGFGKAEIKLSGQSRKGRIHLTLLKYIN